MCIGITTLGGFSCLKCSESTEGEREGGRDGGEDSERMNRVPNWKMKHRCLSSKHHVEHCERMPARGRREGESGKGKTKHRGSAQELKALFYVHPRHRAPSHPFIPSRHDYTLIPCRRPKVDAPDKVTRPWSAVMPTARTLPAPPLTLLSTELSDV